MKKETMKQARDRLVTDNLRLVAFIAKDYEGCGLLMEDLIQEGSIGLMTAAKKFDVRRNCKFSTYAAFWIRREILNAISDQTHTIRIPKDRIAQVSKVEDERFRLRQCLGREPSEEDLADALGWTARRVRQVKDTTRDPVSLDAPVGEEDGACLGDLTPDGNVVNPADWAERALMQDEVQAALASLPLRERTVLKMRFGFYSGRRSTLDEVGSCFNVTREGARQIEARALKKLERQSRSESLRDYLE